MIKLTDILENDILKPRRSPEERQKNYKAATQRKTQKYIKDGGKGDLDLRRIPVEKLPDNLKVGGDLDLMDTSIKKLPDNLKVGGSLDLIDTPLSKKYSEEEIRNIIEEKGGYVKRNIFL